MDDLTRSYEGSQLAPDELAELDAQRRIEARAEAEADYARRARRTSAQSVPATNGPPTLAQAEQRHPGAFDLRVGCNQVRQAGAREVSSASGAHPQSRRNGSGFTGVRPRFKVRWSFGD